MPPQNTDTTSIEEKDKENIENCTWLKAGRVLAHPEPGEEIVISGLAGQYPDSNDVYHFRDNLYGKVDMVTGDNRRWEHTHPEVPERSGKLFHIEKFDAGFFGVHYRQAHSLDPIIRNILERATECIIDAGLNPTDLEGANCGVFVGVCFSESEKTWFFDKLVPQGYAITGCERSMVANRISYFLKLKGPSFICDTACSSSLYAIEHAYKAIRNGDCDSAIVGGANLCLHPFVSLQFARLGVLSKDGSCKCFDEKGNGYARSEAISAVYLQKSKDAKRIYAQILHAKTNCDGYKEQGITYPSGEMQKRLLQEFYQECEIDPTTLSFLEAHGTGTKVGDPEEVAAIDDVFCKGRNGHLLLGSVKSNIGHTEPSSGLCSITKAIIGFENGLIPPNLHFNKPREGLEALEKGRLKVVTEKWPFEDDRGLIGINSFGFGGGNCHVLLKWNTKVKTDGGAPRDDLPRLVCVSGRTEESIPYILDDIKSRRLDADFVRLFHSVFKKDIPGHLYRGYAILTKTGEVLRNQKFFSGDVENLYFGFGGIEDSWHDIGNHLFRIPAFAATIQKIHNVLASTNINITEIIMNNKHDKSLSNYILGNTAVQLGITDVLKTLQLKPHGIFGQSTGEITCAYYDGAITLEEAVFLAVHLGNVLKDVCESTSSFVVDLSEPEVSKLLPADVAVTGIVTNKSTLITGPSEKVNRFINDLKNKKVNVTTVGDCSMSFTTSNLIKTKTQLVQQFKKVISKPKQRSEKWLSNSSEKLISAEYFVDALITPLNFVQLLNKTPRNSVVLDIGSGYLSAILTQSLREDKDYLNVVHFNCDGKKDYVVALLEAVGWLYNYGYHPQLDKIYPKVQFPVSRGTPMISPLIKWNHDLDWVVTAYAAEQKLKTGERTINITLKEDENKFLHGHVVDGRNLFPATGYLNLVWETLALVTGNIRTEMSVIFENVRFNRATHIQKDSKIDFVIMVQRGSGKFEVIEGGTPIVTGRIYQFVDPKKHMLDLPQPLGIRPEEALPMKKKDIYKELRLRGYNYKDAFRALIECDGGAQRGKIEWNNNWITLIDSMFQMKILQLDTRLLYVPTGIERLVIDSKSHMQFVNDLGENPELPVFVYNDIDIIKCGGIEIRGLNASSIPRRKPLGEPVLEKYEFIPNEIELDVQKSIRVNMQLALENNYTLKVKVVEVIDEATKEDSDPVGPVIHNVLSDLPLIQPTISIFSKKTIEVENVTVEDKKLVAETDCLIVVGSSMLGRTQILQQAFGALKENGFVLSREDRDFDISKIDTTGISIFTIHKTDEELFVFLRKTAEYKAPIPVDITDCKEFAWVENLKTIIKNKNNNIVVYAQNDPLNGAIGFINCLRKEGMSHVKCVFIDDPSAPVFDVDTPFYEEQLKKNFAVSVFKEGKWGTYRHLLVENLDEVDTEHAFANVTTRGDLSSMRWIQGSITQDSVLPSEKKLINIYYSALNFRDVMTATGRIGVDAITLDRLQQECVQGIEFSGKAANGKRYMGMAPCSALATLIDADEYFLFEIPDHWSLEEAATVPIVYGTVLYSFQHRAFIKRGQSILIHSGAGGVGQAAIAVALHYGCEIFTTVGTPEKREFIKKNFPQIKDSHIGNSRDTSFEQMIMSETKGRGVDIVLNSLAEEKLLASVRCVAYGGHFLEIGKFDLAQNNPLKLAFLEKEIAFDGIMLDVIFFMSPWIKRVIKSSLVDGINQGYVKPLKAHVFQKNELEQAFRFMTTGKHMGKVLIKIREEEPDICAIPKRTFVKALPRYECDPTLSYVVCGGLGGFGLELADWLIIRGARKMVLNTRNGIKNGYQSYRVRMWRAYGADIVISTADITTKEGCEELINTAGNMGPVHAVFNLAVVLADALMENQSPENYKTSFGPKALATEYLDEVTRRLCPVLRDFVVFSSVSCGRGNIGQTNYGMANSVMERICEKRKIDGLPALAIEWGVVGDVGLVAEFQDGQIDMEIAGTLQQRISNCLHVLDGFMRQNNAVVSSMVVAEKRAGAGGADNIVDAVANILGITNLKTVSLHATLAELGMDSMTAVEIKQTLEREYEVFLTAQDIRSMTFARLQEIQAEKEEQDTDGKKRERLPGGIEMILRLMGDEASANIPVMKLPTKIHEETLAPTVILFPGLEGVASIFKPLAKNLNCHTAIIQFCYDNPEDSLVETAHTVLPHVEAQIIKNQPFKVVAYSFGVIIALEVLAELEKKGYTGGTIMLIDGSPAMIAEMMVQHLNQGSEDEFQTGILVALMSLYMPFDIILRNREKLLKCNSYEERMLVAKDIAPKDTPHSTEHKRQCAIHAYKRLKGLTNYKPTYTSLKSIVKLIKPKDISVKGLPDDYKLSEICEQPVEVLEFEGNHITILESQEVADAINVEVGVSPLFAKESILQDEAGKVNLEQAEIKQI